MATASAPARFLPSVAPMASREAARPRPWAAPRANLICGLSGRGRREFPFVL